jgi:hypothetical protein
MCMSQTTLPHRITTPGRTVLPNLHLKNLTAFQRIHPFSKKKYTNLIRTKLAVLAQITRVVKVAMSESGNLIVSLVYEKMGAYKDEQA